MYHRSVYCQCRREIIGKSTGDTEGGSALGLDSIFLGVWRFWNLGVGV